MEYRTITLAELKAAHFPPHDVLSEDSLRIQRDHDLRSAMAFTNMEHDEVAIIIELQDGERVQYLTDLLEFEDTLVELRGGYAIPVKSIYRVVI